MATRRSSLDLHPSLPGTASGSGSAAFTVGSSPCSCLLASASATLSASGELALNPRWQAPEVIRSQAYSAASDVYSFG